jgi:hypothetical protein
MKKLICILTVSLVITVSAFAQNSGPLDGRYNEMSSTAQVGTEQHKYWLYKLPSYMTFDDIVVELCEYLENRWEFQNGSKGWSIYWDDTGEWNPSMGLANSVKTMMTRLKRNVSVYFEWDGNMKYPPDGMYINYYDSTTDTYKTLYFPCYK